MNIPRKLEERRHRATYETRCVCACMCMCVCSCGTRACLYMCLHVFVCMHVLYVCMSKHIMHACIVYYDGVFNCLCMHYKLRTQHTTVKSSSIIIIIIEL